MKITKNKDIKAKIEELVENNNLNYALSEMFLYAIGNREILSKEEIEFVAKKYNVDINDLVLKYLCDFWEIDPENDENDFIYQTYIAPNIFLADIEKFKSNPYYKSIKPVETKYKGYSLTYDHYAPYELFAYDDIEVDSNYIEHSKLSYFYDEYKFLAINYNDVTWMSVTPNEIKTMESAIKKAHGDIIVFGLGLGYFAYMASLKLEVKNITIIENDENIINLFINNLLPLFENKAKIKIINNDALKVIKQPLKYDFAFVDLWHNAEDGIDLYFAFKKEEKNHPNVEFSYWLERSFYALLRRAFIELLSEQISDEKASYDYAETVFDKLVNKLYEKTKNLQIQEVSDIESLLSDESLLSLIL